MGVVLIIAGIVCALYGALVMSIGSGSWFFAFWFALAAALVGFGWAVRSGVWASLAPLARHAVEGVICVALVGFLVTQVLIFRDFNDEGRPGLDNVIVLGAQVREWGPSTVLRYRLDAAYDYLAVNERTICIVSGGQGSNEPDAEAHVMAAYLSEKGIPAERIIIEDQSRTTDENIDFSMRYFDPKADSVGIVTNDFHLHRALAIARKSGIADPIGIAARSDALFLPNNLARESLSIAKNCIQGNI